jgi:hypothetical protein
MTAVIQMNILPNFDGVLIMRVIELTFRVVVLAIKALASIPG